MSLHFWKAPNSEKKLRAARHGGLREFMADYVKEKSILKRMISKKR